jgi:hypothetical protein
MTRFFGPITQAQSALVEEFDLDSPLPAWQVVAPGFFLPCDWSVPVRVSTTWDTAVLPNQNDGEARRGRLSKPTHRVDAFVLATDQDEAAKALATLQKAGLAKSLFPLYADQMPSAGTGGDTDTFIDVRSDIDPDHYRVQTGQYIAIYDDSNGNFAVRQVTSTSGQRISFSAQAIGFASTSSTVVIPFVEARIELSTSGRAITDDKISSPMSGQELPGEWSISPFAEPGTTPTGFQTYESLPILTFGPDFRADVQIRYNRTGRYSSVGNTQVASLYGARMRQARGFVVSFDNREEFYDFMRFYDSRAGRAFPWWLPSFTNEYAITAFTGTGCRVSTFGPEDDWQLRPYISITLQNGTVEIREIDSVSSDGTEDTLTFKNNVPFNETDLANVALAGFAQKVRFERDEIVEEWSTSTVVDIAVTAVEVIAEEDLTLSNLTDLATTGMSDKWSPVACPFEGGDCSLSESSVLSLSFTAETTTVCSPDGDCALECDPQSTFFESFSISLVGGEFRYDPDAVIPDAFDNSAFYAAEGKPDIVFTGQLTYTTTNLASGLIAETSVFPNVAICAFRETGKFCVDLSYQTVGSEKWCVPRLWLAFASSGLLVTSYGDDHPIEQEIDDHGLFVESLEISNSGVYPFIGGMTLMSYAMDFLYDARYSELVTAGVWTPLSLGACGGTLTRANGPVGDDANPFLCATGSARKHGQNRLSITT